ncbi:hypothetical protein PY247_10745 [Acinetobacter proteolyticus]|nr:hypothetical protein [Acinetobacter proteolyticus]WEI20151.1 hypothetical protein PY247_10745 [Acinetobacter proteolyticus]
MAIEIDFSYAIDGFYDYVNYYRSETPMDAGTMPAPTATGITATTYTDTTATKGKYYYVRFSSVRSGVEKISDEMKILAGTLWLPSNLATPAKMWLDASNSIVDGSNRISQLTDLSGNGFHTTQSNNTNKPVLTSGNAVFNGTNRYMDGAAIDLFKNIGQGYIFAVASKSSIDGSAIERPIIGWSNNAASYRLGLLMGNNTHANKILFGGRRLDGDAYDGVESSFTITTNRMYIMCGVVNYNSREIKLYIDGQLNVSKTNAFTGSGNTANTSSSRSRIGSNFVATPTTYGDVSLKTALSDNQLISDSERQKMEGWAAHKYGLLSNLPSDHPYKSNPPVI